MRVVSRSTLRTFWELEVRGKKVHQDAEGALRAWFREVSKAHWASPAAIKEQYRTASILQNSRVVFNIAGNKYRLVVKIHYNTQLVFVRFVGTHRAYDAINVEEV